MKNNCKYLIFIFIFFTGSSFSQVNSYFQNNPQWQIKMNVYSGYDCSGNQFSYNYITNGDTIINANVYKKIYKKGITTSIGGFCQTVSITPYINATPSFYLRSLGKKMFLFNPGDSDEQLLYDFGLFVGDTLPATYTYQPGDPNYSLIVTAIDSIYTPYGYRKRFILSGGGNDTLFEGIGSTGGLVEYVTQVFLSGDHHLVCYSLNDVSYVPSIGSSCNLGVGIPYLRKEKPLLVSPNPFSDKTTLQFNHEIQEASFKVFNVHGTEVENIVFSGTYITFERGKLNSGLYYYRIEVDKENVLTGKLIIID